MVLNLNGWSARWVTSATKSGRTPEGLDGIAWCRRVCELGVGEILLTSMDRDGTGAGYDVELITRVATAIIIPVIASGGVGQLAHLAAGLEADADAVLAASIFHFGQHTIPEAKRFLAARGLAIRPPFRKNVHRRGACRLSRSEDP